MKTDLTSRCGLLSSLRFNPLHAVAAASLLLSGPGALTSRAGQILVDGPLLSAPPSQFAWYGMYSADATAASFTLVDSYFVSTIDVVLRTPAATSFNTFDFSLQNALTDPITVFASENLTAPLGAVSTQVMNVNETLPAGTYYLAGIVPGYYGTPITPDDVDAWMVSTGVYSGAAGTIANGVWEGNPPIFGTGSFYVAPAFTVNGSPVPEPSMWAMLAAGTASLLARRRWKQALTHW